MLKYWNFIELAEFAKRTFSNINNKWRQNNVKDCEQSLSQSHKRIPMKLEEHLKLRSFNLFRRFSFIFNSEDFSAFSRISRKNLIDKKEDCEAQRYFLTLVSSWIPKSARLTPPHQTKLSRINIYIPRFVDRYLVVDAGRAKTRIQ